MTDVASHHRSGSLGWVGLVGYVVLFDVLAVVLGGQTLSSAFYQASTTVRRRVWLFGVWAYLTAHLFRWLPKRVDVFRRLDEVGAKW